MPFADLVKEDHDTREPRLLSETPEMQLLWLDESEKRSPDFIATNYFLRINELSETISIATSDLRDLIAFEFSQTPEIKYVYTAFRENRVFYAWVIVDDFEESVRSRIYDREEAIIDAFPEIEFDFYIVPRMGRDVRDLIDDSVHLTYDKTEI